MVKLASQASDENVGARGTVATTVGLRKNGKTTTTTTNLAPLDPASAATGQAAASPAASSPSSNDLTQNKKVLYGLDDCPAWYLCIFLGLQVGYLFVRLCRYFDYYFPFLLPRSELKVLNISDKHRYFVRFADVCRYVIITVIFKRPCIGGNGTSEICNGHFSR